MSPRNSRPPLPPAGISRRDPDGQTWQTPVPEPVPAPQADVALAVRGSRRALWRFARGALIRWAIFALPLAGFVALEFTDQPVSSKVFCGLCAVAVAWSPVRRTVAVLRATRAMATRPWRLYRTASVPLVGPIRLEVWQDGDKKATHGYLRITALGVKRDELSSPVYRNVWIAGDVAHGGVLVPSGGGEGLVWARATRGPQTRTARVTKPAQPAKPKSPKAIARELARKEKARERAAKARARVAARAERARQRAKDNPPPLKPTKTPTPRQPRTPRRGRDIGKGLPFQEPRSTADPYIGRNRPAGGLGREVPSATCGLTDSATVAARRGGGRSAVSLGHGQPGGPIVGAPVASGQHRPDAAPFSATVALQDQILERKRALAARNPDIGPRSSALTRPGRSASD